MGHARGEGIDVQDPICRQRSLIVCDNEDGIEAATLVSLKAAQIVPDYPERGLQVVLSRPTEVQGHCHGESSDDGPVLEQVERNERVPSELPLPEDKARKRDGSSDYKSCDDVRPVPLCLLTTGSAHYEKRAFSQCP